MVKPSFLAMGISGILIGLAIFVLLTNQQARSEMTGLKLVNLILFMSTAIAIHGMLHMWAEIYYQFNPLEGKFNY